MANNIFVYDDASEVKGKPFYKSCLGMTMIGVIVFIAMTWAASKKVSNDIKTSNDLGVYTDPTEVPEAKNFGWVYNTSKDQMDGSTVKYAEIRSTTSVQFEFPHDLSDFYLGVRKQGGATDVFITCTDCQFITGYSDDKLYRVKCFEGKNFSVTANGSSSGGTDIVFLGSVNKILNTLKKCESFSVECEFYDYGRHVVHFNTTGFQW